MGHSELRWPVERSRFTALCSIFWRQQMSVVNDATYIETRAATFAAYEVERDLSLKRKDRGEYKEGEFERVRDAQRAEYVATMTRAYADFQAREARQVAGTSGLAGSLAVDKT